MCFSAGASFTAAAVLLTVGVLTLRKATLPSQKYFAGIPLIFAIQQFAEGIVWLSLTGSFFAPWQVPATYFFLLFAQLFWPIWVPLSLLKLENDKRSKKILALFLMVGIIIALSSGWLMINNSITAEIRGFHIYYDIHHPSQNRTLSGLIYLIPTVLSGLACKTKGVWIFALLNFMAYLVSKFYFNDHVISVWCFFAALISVVIYFILAGKVKR